MKDLKREIAALLLVPVLFLNMVSKAYALPAVVSLNVTRCEQQESNWCWAACINTMSQDSMYTKLAQGYPIPIKMLWNSGGAHDVLIIGYTSEGLLTITDPGEGCSEKRYRSYSALINGTTISSGTGKYIRTWLITS